MLNKFLITFLSFSRSLATKCVLLNNETCMIRRTFLNLNPDELNYYALIVSLDKCSASSNAADDVSSKICVLSKTEDIHVNKFNMITRINEAKTLIKHTSCDCKCKFNSTACNSNQKWNTDTCQCKCKKCRMCKNIVGILEHLFVRIVGI